MSVNTSIESKVSSFLSTPKSLLIGGRWQPSQSEKTFRVENPANKTKLASVAYGSKEDIDLAVAAARQAFESGDWSRMSAKDRAQRMWRLADLIEQHKDELAYLESVDNGKPFAVAQAAESRWQLISFVIWQVGQPKSMGVLFRFCTLCS